VAGNDSAEVFEFVKEPRQEILFFPEARAKLRQSSPVRHQPDISPRAAFGKAFTQEIAIAISVGQQNLTRPSVPNISAAERPSWAWPSVSFSRIRTASGIRQRVDFVPSRQLHAITCRARVRPPRARPMRRDRLAFFDRWQRVGAPGSRICRSLENHLDKPLKLLLKALPLSPLCAIF
jgi:hypothetical protein